MNKHIPNASLHPNLAEECREKLRRQAHDGPSAPPPPTIRWWSAETGGQGSEYQPKHPLQIAEQFDLLAGSLIAQREVLHTLGDRLTRVMSLGPPAASDLAGPAESDPTCPLAANLADLTREIRQDTALITGWLRLLEI